jgi:D-tyrosyl-tRNA(Tyr) deacylase
MIGLIQRVSEAQVQVDGQVTGQIGTGLLALIGVQRADDERSAKRLLDRILGYRVFADKEQRMNLSLTDIAGGLLLVPQFTLAADTRKGMRASFTSAADPDVAERLFAYLADSALERHVDVATGVFGADMKVHLVNEGPVTFWLQTSPPANQTRIREAHFAV